MFKAIRRISEALQKLVDVLVILGDLLDRDIELRSAGGDVAARVEALENELARWEASIEADLARAEGQFRAARAAEERARGMERRARVFGEGDEEGDAELEGWIARQLELQGGNASGGQEEGVSAMRSAVEHDPEEEEAALRRAKFNL